MKKRLVSIILTVFLVLSMMPFAAFADNAIVCPACGGEVTKKTYHLVGNYWDFYKCNTCGKWAYLSAVAGLKLLSAGDQAIINAADANAILNFAFNNGHLIPAEKVPSGIGRKDLPGYADDKGSALVDKDGWPTATYTMLLDGYDTSVGVNTVYKHSDSNNGSWFTQGSGHYSGDNGSLFAYSFLDPNKNSTHSFKSTIAYYYIAPVDGYYTLNDLNLDVSVSIRMSDGNYTTSSNTWTCYNVKYYWGQGVNRPNSSLPSVYPSSDLKLANYKIKSSTKYFNKGAIIYFSIGATQDLYINGTYPYHYLSLQCSAPTLIVQDLTPNQITNNNNITINKNTWNGNIYVDNSTNLTYIYPQYTTINESGDTVTNISENPIIYNNETQQYYTYDTVTNNYYYITYEQQPATPTPSPSPSPSPTPTEAPSPSESPAPTPTPDPGENPILTPTPGGGTTVTPGGDNPGSTSTPESGNKGDSGSSGWNPFKWLTDLLKDLVESILKGIWKLITSIFGFILWLLSLLFKLFPWIPNSGILALCAGVVVVTVIRIIKFIIGR